VVLLFGLAVFFWLLSPVASLPPLHPLFPTMDGYSNVLPVQFALLSWRRFCCSSPFTSSPAPLQLASSFLRGVLRHVCIVWNLYPRIFFFRKLVKSLSQNPFSLCFHPLLFSFLPLSFSCPAPTSFPSVCRDDRCHNEDAIFLYYLLFSFLFVSLLPLLFFIFH